MAQGREEKKPDEEPAQPGPVRFTPLDGSRWEDSGYLPSEDDQSWREMEALRIDAYDRIGHLPPRDDQSWREREALRLAAAREAAEVAEVSSTDGVGAAGNADDLIADLAAPIPELAAYPISDPVADADSEPMDQIPEIYVPVRDQVRASGPDGRGAGGVMLVLVAVVGLVTAALAFPGILTPDFWRAQWTAARSLARPAIQPERVANVPAPALAAERPLPPPSQPAPVIRPALNGEPPANNEPPANAEQPANAEPYAASTANAMPEAAPTPRPDARASADRGTMVIGRDGTVKYENGSVPGARAARRASQRDDAEDRGTGGFYAKAPGPDGVLRYQYFPSRPEPDSRRAARGDDDKNDNGDGVYAMAPGPDGKLEYQYFPPTPPR